MVLLLPVYAVMGKKAAAVKDQSPAAVAERMISILPKFRLTGVEAVDEDQKAARKRMKSVFQEILEDPTSVLSVSEHLSTRKSSKERAAKEASLHPPMPSVQRIPSEVMVAELANISDLSVDEIAECKEHDSESDKQLWIFATGEPMPLRMSEDMRDKSIFSMVTGVRDSLMGQRLMDFKVQGALKQGKINWKYGVYTPVFVGKSLQAITHKNGDRVKVGAMGLHVSPAWHLHSNWNDWEAYFSCPPLAPQPVRACFQETSLGPFNTSLVRGAQAVEQFKAFIAQKVAEVNLAKNTLLQVTGNASASSSERVDQAKASIGQIKSKQAKKRASTAQEKAMISLQGRRMSRAVLLRRRSSAISEDPPLAVAAVPEGAPAADENKDADACDAGGDAGGDPPAASEVVAVE